jgi:hypothetical protein
MSSRWYDKSGRLVETLPNGKTPTVTDARKLGLIPSVTTVLDIIDKPWLNTWKMKEILKIAYKNRDWKNIIDDEWTRDEFVNSMLDEFSSAREDILDLGGDVHHMMERYLQGQDVSLASSGLVKLVAFTIFDEYLRPWLDENIEKVYATEGPAISSDGRIAGTVDLDAEVKNVGRTIVDLKTQGVKPNRQTGAPDFRFYESFPRQLAAYREMVNPKPKACVSLVVSTNLELPGVRHKVYTEGELDREWTYVNHLIEAFYLSRGLK